MPHVMNVDSNNKLAMQGYCPVSYQFGPVPEMGLPEESSEYEGAIYRFSSTKGKELFDAQPAKYAPLYGGWYVSFVASQSPWILLLHFVVACCFKIEMQLVSL